ncbi:MAG: phosphotransferase [Candidatus Dependentiae bacterium]|nr:phosphotransferase [Candidatus Dependentiae bacterium]
MQWKLDKDITVEIASQVLEEQLFTVEDIKILGQGFDNVALLVNHNLVFRFPRHSNADIYQLKNENPILQKLQSVISLKIPNPIYIGRPTSYYPYHFQGYEKIEGVAVYQVDLTEQELLSCLKNLALFLKQVHSITALQAQNWGLERSGYDHTCIETMLEALQPRIDSIIAQNIFELDLSFIATEIEIAKTIKIPDDADCLIHGDLHFKHIIMKDKKLIGIIDWGDVDINHPVVDFAIIHELFPVSMHNVFFELYCNIDLKIWQYARFLALKSIITSILCGYDTKDQQLFDAAVQAYKRLKNS